MIYDGVVNPVTDLKGGIISAYRTDLNDGVRWKGWNEHVAHSKVGQRGPAEAADLRVPI